jgi:lipopolysaccharide export system protein LptC
VGQGGAVFSVRQRLLALILAGIGGVAWWYQAQQGPEAPPLAPRQRLPDYRVEGFSATTMDAAGRPARSLSAPELRHFADDDSSEIDQPVLVVYTADGPPWNIRSETGWASGDGELLRLHGEVMADREGNDKVRPMHLRTSELLVRPRQDYAETAMPVRIDSNDDWLTSTGMQAWFGEDDLRARFLGRARGRFAVQ